MGVGESKRFVTLREADISPDPFQQFRRWFEQALAAPLHEPYAVALATADVSGRPSVRMVLLRGLDARGFVFFTHHDSRKGTELNDNPRAALLFYWGELERQVRIEGRVERTSEQESDAYFHTRPRGSQLSAWASRQGQVVANRGILEERMAELEKRYQGQDVPRPTYWGGYRVMPEVIEFWQGGLNRLHDRLRYERRPDGSWLIERLSP